MKTLKSRFTSLWFCLACQHRISCFLMKYNSTVISSLWLACENIRFSSLFAAGDVSRGGTSATQRQKFHTDDAIQCLHNKSSSHGVPNTNLSNFTCLLVDFGTLLCSSANEIQQNSRASSREDYISTNTDCFVRCRTVCFCFVLSVLFAESQTFLRAKRSHRRRARRNGCFRRLRCDWLFSLSEREVSPGNRSNYKSAREKVDSKGLYGRWRLHLMGSCHSLFLFNDAKSHRNRINRSCRKTRFKNITTRM